jgi:hypothetical protein
MITVCYRDRDIWGYCDIAGKGGIGEPHPNGERGF